jgi:hypothetical protein
VSDKVIILGVFDKVIFDLIFDKMFFNVVIIEINLFNEVIHAILVDRLINFDKVVFDEVSDSQREA